MTRAIFGNGTAEKVLLYVLVRRGPTPGSLSQAFRVPSRHSEAAAALERGGVLVSRAVGRTRPLRPHPEYAFVRELEALLRRALQSCPRATRPLLASADSTPGRRKPL